MINKHEIKSLIIISLPLMAAFLAQRGMQFIDSVMMGWIGPTALAAGALGTALFFTIFFFCNGILSAIGIFIARAKGANNYDDIQSTLQHGFCLALLLAIPGMMLIWFIPGILLKLGEDPSVVKDATSLLHGMAWGFPGFLLFLVLREFISAFSLTLIVMIVSFLSVPLTFFANYILIYGKYHLPELGIAGIGYGGSIVMWFMFFCLLAYSKKKSVLKKYFLLTPFRFDRTKFFDMLHIGTPSGVLFLLDAGMFLSTVILMGYFGVSALAAHQIALQCVNIAYTIPIAISMATALQVGHAAGANNMEQVKRSAIHSFGLVLLVSAVIAMIYIFAANYIVNLFLEKNAANYQAIHQLTISLLDIAALFLCFDALQAVANGALRGLKDTLIPMIMSLICYWVLGVGGAYFLSMHTELGAKGIWFGLTLGLSSSAIILLLRFFRMERTLRSRASHVAE
jgi:MATE family multidrug resistance protein